MLWSYVGLVALLLMTCVTWLGANLGSLLSLYEYAIRRFEALEYQNRSHNQTSQ